MLCESANNLEGEAAERIGLDKLIKIHIKKFSGDAKMATKIEALGKVDHAMFVFRILTVLVVNLKTKVGNDSPIRAAFVGC